MTLLYLPFFVLDAMLEMHACMWKPLSKEPIIIVLEAEPPPAAIAA